MRWIGICDGNMQEGSFRCDANVSVRPMGADKLGTRCEIKNLNSFRFLEKAIEYEVRRQVELIEDGGQVRQETRLWDPQKGETRSMRSKEDAHDYRYFPDPDLLPLEIAPAWIAAVKATMPELPARDAAAVRGGPGAHRRRCDDPHGLEGAGGLLRGGRAAGRRRAEGLRQLGARASCRRCSTGWRPRPTRAPSRRRRSPGW